MEDFITPTEETKKCLHEGVYAPGDNTVSHMWCDHCKHYIPVTEL